MIVQCQYLYNSIAGYSKQWSIVSSRHYYYVISTCNHPITLFLPTEFYKWLKVDSNILSEFLSVADPFKHLYQTFTLEFWVFLLRKFVKTDVPLVYTGWYFTCTLITQHKASFQWNPGRQRKKLKINGKWGAAVRLTHCGWIVFDLSYCHLSLSWITAGVHSVKCHFYTDCQVHGANPLFIS